MHACGHDEHTVWLIGLARQLAARKSEWSGTAVLVAQPAVLTVGAIQAGDSNNIISDSATLKVNLRCYTEAERDQMIKGIKSVTDNIARMYGIPNDRMPTYTMKGHSKPVINGKEDTQQARLAIQAALGEDKVLRGMPPVMGSEDLHMLGSPYPDTRILYIEIGSGAKDVYSNFMEKGILPEVLNHNQRYVVEPEAIATGTTALTSVVLSFLSK